MELYVNGRQQMVQTEYDKVHATMQVVLPEIAVTSEAKLVSVAEDGLLNDNSDARERMFDACTDVICDKEQDVGLSAKTGPQSIVHVVL